MAMASRRTPALDVLWKGHVPCNKRRWRDAGLVMYRHSYGIISMEFAPLGIGDRRDERDEKGNLKDFCVKTVEYGEKTGYIGADFVNGESYEGIVFFARDRHDVFLSKKTYPSGDIREIIPVVLKEIKWPTDPWQYHLMSKIGEFWNRQYPMGYNPCRKR